MRIELALAGLGYKHANHRMIKYSIFYNNVPQGLTARKNSVEILLEIYKQNPVYYICEKFLN